MFSFSIYCNQSWNHTDELEKIASHIDLTIVGLQLQT
jgi:hypothetical protein